MPLGWLDHVVDRHAVRADLQALFGDRRVVNLQGTAGSAELDLTEIDAFTPFLVPGDEKGWPDALFRWRVPD